MTILHVASLGQPVLRQVARQVERGELKDKTFQAFLDDLLESMRFHDGVGLAAPQVFRTLRVVAVCVPPDLDEAGKGLDPTVFINPELSLEGEEMEEDWEGCLSLKDLRGLVPRCLAVRLRALDRHGKPIEMRIQGFPARVVQHECDHLEGIVFLDRMEDLSSLGFSGELERTPSPCRPEDE